MVETSIITHMKLFIRRLSVVVLFVILSTGLRAGFTAEELEELGYETLLTQLQSKIDGFTAVLVGCEQDLELAKIINDTLFNLTRTLAFVPTNAEDKLFQLPLTLKQKLHKDIENNLVAYYGALTTCLLKISKSYDFSSTLSLLIAGLKQISRGKVHEIERIVGQHKDRCPTMCALSVYLALANPCNCKEYCIKKDGVKARCVPAYLLKQVFTYYTGPGLDHGELMDIDKKTLDRTCERHCGEEFAKCLLGNPSLSSSAQKVAVAIFKRTLGEDYNDDIESIKNIIKASEKNSKNLNYGLFSNLIRVYCGFDKSHVPCTVVYLDQSQTPGDYLNSTMLYNGLGKSSANYRRSIRDILEIIGKANRRMWDMFEEEDDKVGELYMHAIELVTLIPYEGLRVEMLERIITSMTTVFDSLKRDHNKYFLRLWAPHDYNLTSCALEDCYFCMPHVCMPTLLKEIPKITDPRTSRQLLDRIMPMLAEVFKEQRDREQMEESSEVEPYNKNSENTTSLLSWDHH